MMNSIKSILGINFLLKEIPYEVFTYSEKNPMEFVKTPTNAFPYMVSLLYS